MKQQILEAVDRSLQFLKIPQTLQENICVWVSWSAMLLKRDFNTAKVFPKKLQYCEIFKNTHLEKHLWTAAYENHNQIFQRKVSFLTF